jgi:hypothetical protein
VLVNLDVQEYQGKDLTGRAMYSVVRDYHDDIGDYAAWPLPAWFDLVRYIPYESDNERFPERPMELVPRPKYLLDRSLFPRIDCKKKSILIAAWAESHGVPYRFVAVSQKPNRSIHHVFPQLLVSGEWVTMDATFPEYEMGQGHPITYAEVLGR